MKRIVFFFCTVFGIWAFLAVHFFSPFLVRAFPFGTFGYTACLLLPLPLLFMAATFPLYYATGSVKAWLFELGLRRPEKADLPAVLRVIPLYFLLMFLAWLAQKLGLSFPEQGLVQYAEKCSDGAFVMLVVSVLVLAPLSEEIMYRSIFSETLALFVRNKWVRNVVVSLIFAISHGFVFQCISLFALAFCLQMEKDRSGSTTRTVLMHSTFNFCSVLLLILERFNLL